MKSLNNLIVKVKPNILYEVSILLIGMVIGFILGMAFAR